MAARRSGRGRKPGTAEAALQPITATSLDRITIEPLRAEAAGALARGEAVALLVGSQESGRVETLLFSPSGRGAQSTGWRVFRGTWSGERLSTEPGGHFLDRDGNCFCRACEVASGYGVDDDE